MSFDDLLGDDTPPEPARTERKKTGRPKGSKSNVNAVLQANNTLRTNSVHQALGGVSVRWLATIFRMSPQKVLSELGALQPKATTQNGGALYDGAEAASYLVPPKKDFRAQLKHITAKELPQELREAFWNAKTKEAKYRVMAGELWPTASILDVLGETFKSLKSTTQLWTDTIDESVGLTNEQRTLLTTLVDHLMGELHAALITQAKSSMTESYLKELDDED